MNEQPHQQTIVLGSEYDDELRRTLLEVLSEIGAVESTKSYGGAGSQEVQTMFVKIRAETIGVEAETYIGLSVTGEPTLVHTIADRVKKRLPRLDQPQ